MADKPGAIIIEGHVQGLSNTRSLGEAGIPVFVVDNHNCVARYSKYCNKFFRCPDFKSDAFIDFLMELGEEENLTGWLLLPSNDHVVYNLSKHKNRLKEIYKLITPGINIVSLIYNKENLLNIAEISQTPFPISWFPKTFEEKMPDNISFPILIKGKFGLSFYKATGRKAFQVDEPSMLTETLANLSDKIDAEDLFIQELIPLIGINKTLSFTAFCENGVMKAYWMGVKLREHPFLFGTATFAESVLEKRVLEPSQRLLKQLQYTGVCEIEYLKDLRDGDFKLIEINARTWLWVGLAKACGVDYAIMVYNYINGLEQNFPSDYLLGLKWRNLFTDFFFSCIAIIKRKISLWSIFRQNKGKIVDALWQKRDPVPFIMYFVLRFNIIRKR